MLVGGCKLVWILNRGKLPVKQIAVFTLLVALNGAWSIPVKAQDTGAVEYGRQSQIAAKKSAKQQKKMVKRAAKRQRKAIKKYAKDQRKAAKNPNRRRAG
jgi:hypothetical protein